MKKILSMLMLTVMLRVWWPEHKYLGTHHLASSGIVINVGSYGWIYVKEDGGGIASISGEFINKMRWVEVKAEREK